MMEWVFCNIQNISCVLSMGIINTIIFQLYLIQENLGEISAV